MKLIITFVAAIAISMACRAEDFVNGSFFVKSASDGIPFNWVSQTETKADVLKAGKTYSSDKNLFELKGTDQEVIFQFSSGLMTQLDPKAEFRVDAFNQMVPDISVEPSTLKSGDFILNVALMDGSGYFVAPKYNSPNSMCVLQTPLMNLELNGGKYHIKTSLKFTFIYILEGTVGIFDNQTNEKKTKNAGTMVLIFPSPMNATETMITEKAIDKTELEKMLSILDRLEKTKSQTIFIIINQKIVGVGL